jgi:transglycosylase-like protein with SLT domain
MSRNEQATRPSDIADLPLRPRNTAVREHSPSRTIVVRHGTVWQSLAFLFLCLLLIAVVLLGHRALGDLEQKNQETALAVARFEAKLQKVESGLGFDSKRRQLLLGMRDHILTVNPRVGLGDAYHYAQLALEASEKYPAVDPLLLLSIGTVESRYDPQAKSTRDARGLYQIWPSTGRLLLRTLGWEYDEAALYDPEKNTQAAALYLDILFTTYSDPQLVLAEYNGGPLNAGYFRARVGALAAETRDYVPQVLDLYGRLRARFEKGIEVQPELMHRDAHREGKTLAGPVPSGGAAAAPVPRPVDGAATAAAPGGRFPRKRP